MKKAINFVLLSLVLSQPALALDTRKIMQEVFDREDGKSQYSIQTIASCKYIVQDKRIACAETPRIKTIETANKDYGKDSRSIMIIQEPAAESGIGFLQYDYDEAGKDSDQWMYLSALGKVKRIVSGNEDEPKTGTLFGSEFSYEDIEKRHIDDFSYKLIKEESYQGRDCWVIESTPVAKYARKSNYSRSLQWIDKQRLVILKALMYDRSGKLLKHMAFSQYQQQDGIWLATKMNMNNVQSKRISTMKMDTVKINIAINDKLLTQRTLTDAAFREIELNKLRQMK